MPIPTLLIFAFLASHPPQDSLTVRDAKALLNSTGYTIKVEHPNDLAGTIQSLGATVTVRLLIEPWARGMASDTLNERPMDVLGISLTIEVPVGREVPLGESRGQINDSFMFDSSKLSNGMNVAPHLGQTVTLQRTIPLNGNIDRRELAQSLDAFWRDGAAYAKSKKGTFSNAPERDWSRYQFSESIVVDRLDSISLDRLMTSWGYAGNDYHGLKFWVDTHSAPGKAIEFCASMTPPESTDSFTWGINLKYSINWADVSPSLKGPAVFIRSIDAAKGITLGEFRKELETFARNVLSVKTTVGHDASPPR